MEFQAIRDKIIYSGTLKDELKISGISKPSQ